MKRQIIALILIVGVVLFGIYGCSEPVKVQGVIYEALPGCINTGKKVGYYKIKGFSNIKQEYINVVGIAKCNLPVDTVVCSENGLTFKECSDGL